MSKKKSKKTVLVDLVFQMKVKVPADSNLDDIDDLMGELSIVVSPDVQAEVVDVVLNEWKVADDGKNGKHPG